MNRLRPILRRPPTTSPLELEGLKTHTTFSSCAQVRCAIQIPPFWRHRGTGLLGCEGEKTLIGCRRANETLECYHGVVFRLLNGTAPHKRCGRDICIRFSGRRIVPPHCRRRGTHGKGGLKNMRASKSGLACFLKY